MTEQDNQKSDRAALTKLMQKMQAEQNSWLQRLAELQKEMSMNGYTLALKQAQVAGVTMVFDVRQQQGLSFVIIPTG